MRRAQVVAVLLVASFVSACGAESAPGDRPASAPKTSAGEPSASAGQPTPTPPPTPSPSPSTTKEASARRPARGIDASHHQGSIDWQRVRRDRIDFAYLKATEGSSFTDPRFVDHARAARRAGLRVGGYHYFTLCSPGAPQAEHFAEVLGIARASSLPPAIDLELLGNCSDPPARSALLREIKTFVDAVERRTGQRIVVYAYPDFESRYRIADALHRRLWVRRIGNKPPTGNWWIWQRDDQASIDGIDAPADLNVMRP